MGEYKHLLISLLVLSGVFVPVAYYTFPRKGQPNIVIALLLGLTWPFVVVWYLVRHAVPFVGILVYKDAQRLLPKPLNYSHPNILAACHERLPSDYQTGQWIIDG